MTNVSPNDPFKKTSNLNAGIVITLTLLHVAAIAALFECNWPSVIVAAAIYWIAGSWGIGMCYHRLLTHRGYKTYQWFEYFTAVCGTLALQGGPLSWVATHRVHHQRSDHDGDPHSPNDGAWWSHAGWVMFGEANHHSTETMSHYCPDLAKDRFYTWLNTYHWVPSVVLAVALFAVGGWPMILWGIAMRIVFGLQTTWLVNSATHMWGRRRFATHDNSRNSWWVALLTFGEGWHNNHHAHPVSARHGLAWYELDFNWLQIWLCEKVGLAWDVYVPRWKTELPEEQAAA